MKTGQDGINLIKQFEGCRLEAYKCPAGVWTIGYGHTAGVIPGQKITQAQADAFLIEDLHNFEKKVDKYSRYGWRQNEFDAMVSFAYNVGNIDRLTANGTRSKDVIADKMLLYNKDGGKVLTGLIRRGEAERKLFLQEKSGTDGNKDAIKDLTTIMVGSARIDENGRISGGNAGDQKQTASNDVTGEVSMQTMYMHSKGWYILRPLDANHAGLIASKMIQACNNANIGYDQGNRLGVITYGIGTATKTECDCSSLVRACVKEATGKDPGNFSTANEAAFLESTGLFEKRQAYISQAKTPVYNGDVLVTKTKGHTVIVTNGNPRVDQNPEISSNSISSSGIKVGDIVSYSGNIHYTNSYASGKSHPCKGGKAKVTQISKDKPHPYHLVSAEKRCTVHGWVDASRVFK